MKLMYIKILIMTLKLSRCVDTNRTISDVKKQTDLDIDNEMHFLNEVTIEEAIIFQNPKYIKHKTCRFHLLLAELEVLKKDISNWYDRLYRNLSEKLVYIESLWINPDEITKKDLKTAVMVLNDENLIESVKYKEFKDYIIQRYNLFSKEYQELKRIFLHRIDECYFDENIEIAELYDNLDFLVSEFKFISFRRYFFDKRFIKI